jgi:hypothetical protein
MNIWSCFIVEAIIQRETKRGVARGRCLEIKIDSYESLNRAWLRAITQATSASLQSK